MSAEAGIVFPFWHWPLLLQAIPVRSINHYHNVACRIWFLAAPSATYVTITSVSHIDSECISVLIISYRRSSFCTAGSPPPVSMSGGLRIQFGAAGPVRHICGQCSYIFGCLGRICVIKCRTIYAVRQRLHLRPATQSHNHAIRRPQLALNKV